MSRENIPGPAWSEPPRAQIERRPRPHQTMPPVLTFHQREHAMFSMQLPC